MKTWTKGDVILAVSMAVLTAAITLIVASSGLAFSVYGLFFLPLAFTAALAFLLKRRGKRLRFCAVVVALMDVLLLAGVANSNVITRFYATLTGHYNVEAVTFLLAIPLCYGLGVLIGLGLGALLAQPGKRG